jgi:hypothetical protein
MVDAGVAIPFYLVQDNFQKHLTFHGLSKARRYLAPRKRDSSLKSTPEN